MTTSVRIASRLAREIEADLRRPHAFASERVGFAFARWARTDVGIVVMPYGYMPIADEQYIEDARVGAKIGGAAIRAALQKTLSDRAACLHVHEHPPVMPNFGGLDLQEQAKLIPSFVATIPGAPHGALLFYERGVTARIWAAGELVNVDRVVEVGFPLRISRRMS